SRLMQGVQRAQAFLPALLRARFWHTHAVTRRQEAHSLRERHVFMLHQKTEDIATGMAAKAIKKPLHGAHGKRRGLLLMKRAQPLSVSASPLQLDIVADDIDDIRPEQNFLNNLFRNELAHVFPLRVQQSWYHHQHHPPENAAPGDDAPGGP